VRGLENVLERSFLFATGPVIEDILIDAENLRRDQETASDDFALRSMKKRAAMDIESKVLREALLRCEGNVSATAREMGITPRAVHQKLKSHGIDPVSYRRRTAAQIIAAAGST
jgi:Nif-specific regulatory protein/two-component system response regulator AtoC